MWDPHGSGWVYRRLSPHGIESEIWVWVYPRGCHVVLTCKRKGDVVGEMDDGDGGGARVPKVVGVLGYAE